MKNIITLLTIAFSLTLNAQNTDIKKDKIYVDDVLFLDADGCKFKVNSCPMRTPEGNAVFTVSSDTYTYYNNAAKDYKDARYVIIRFLDFDLEMNSKRTFKKLFALMQKENLIKDGKISLEDATKFAKMYHDEVDGGVELIIR